MLVPPKPIYPPLPPSLLLLSAYKLVKVNMSQLLSQEAGCRYTPLGDCCEKVLYNLSHHLAEHGASTEAIFEAYRVANELSERRKTDSKHQVLVSAPRKPLVGEDVLWVVTAPVGATPSFQHEEVAPYS